jgi:ABC-type sugar transport system permease subunit
VLLSTLGCLRAYAIVVVLTNGGPYSSTRTVLMEMFDQGIASGNVGYASSIAVVMSIVMMIISVVQLKVSKYDSN